MIALAEGDTNKDRCKLVLSERTVKIHYRMFAKLEIEAALKRLRFT